MMISCIVAVGKNNVIGKDNDIPWYLPADLQYFKKTTLHSPIIMGRNCFASIGRPLPKRTNIIVTRDMFFITTNCTVCRSIPEALKEAHALKANEVFIIGGGQIYEQTKDLWEKLYITHVDIEVEGDIFFPEIVEKNWRLIQKTDHLKDEKNEYDYSFSVLERV
ncbi:MAG: dihydrofolate reductase [Saprospiraceae bacterium]